MSSASGQFTKVTLRWEGLAESLGGDDKFAAQILIENDGVFQPANDRDSLAAARKTAPEHSESPASCTPQ